jgi:hypothetical protein
MIPVGSAEEQGDSKAEAIERQGLAGTTFPHHGPDAEMRYGALLNRS